MAVTSVFPASFNLTDLNGANGFVINGIAAGDQSGYSVFSAGDVNGDGLTDILIGAFNASVHEKRGAGQSYVVFGKNVSWQPIIELSELDGSNGFSLNGDNANDDSGYAVASVNDINGDGFWDLLIGAPSADNSSSYGKTHVVFGKKEAWSAIFELSTLNASNGFTIEGVAAASWCGYSVASAGDLNNDGIMDIIIGANYANPNGKALAGQSYVIFGKNTLWNATFELSLLDGRNGFMMNGVAPNDKAGNSVATAGDVNGDGLDDVVIASYHAAPNGRNRAGQSYVVFGKSIPWDPILELSTLNGTNGFALNGMTSDRSGTTVASADINGDGLTDLLIGAYSASPHGQTSAGICYVVFGQKTPWNATFELSTLNGSNGFVINGINAFDSSANIASLGDFNGDGISDILIGGALYAITSSKHFNDNGIVQTNNYVIFGKTTHWDPIFELSSLDGSNGFVLDGFASGIGGHSVASAGDINKDGLMDILIGTPTESPHGKANAGRVYVVFGDRPISLIRNQLTVTQGQSVILNSTHLSANSGSFTSSLIQFSVSNVQHGRFELINNPGIAISKFTQAQLDASLVRFVQDGSIYTPAYLIAASTDIGLAIPSAPQAANVVFLPFVLSHYPARLNVTTLNGNNGFILNGIAASDLSGYTVSSAGDFNGDGISDILIGAYGADPNGRANAGQSYVVFGRNATWNATLELSELNGNNGFILNGITANDVSGDAISSVRDISGDGLADILIGASRASPNDKLNAGQSYVVFGSRNPWNATFELSVLDGSNGFILNGIAANDWSGYAVSSAGDINGDGIMDLVIGANHASPNGKTLAGQSYVIFGRSTPWNATFELSLLDGRNGFILNGVNSDYKAGNSVSPAGDINGDDLDDVLIGSYHAAPDGRVRAGQSYVVFGKHNPWNATLELSTLNGVNGFALNGFPSDRSGTTVASADINGDGLKDLLIGAYSASPNGQVSAGVCYVVFGQNRPWNATFELSTLNGNNGFVINAVNTHDSMGNIVSPGDFNDDGIADILIGGSFYSASNDPYNLSSRSNNYVIFGKATDWAPTFDLSSLDGKNGFVLDGFMPTTYGHAVASAGDMNGDGLMDILIGAPLEKPNGQTNAGRSYVVFGDRTIPLISNRLTVTQGQPIILNNTYLSADSGAFASSLIQYSVSNIQHGQFELVNNPGIAISNFTQAQVNAELVHFVPDGSANVPVYSIAAQTGIGFAILPAPQTANVSMMPPVQQTVNTSASTFNLSMIAGAAAGASALAVLGGVLWYRRRAARKQAQEDSPHTRSSADSTRLMTEITFNTEGMKVNPLLEVSYDNQTYDIYESQVDYAQPESSWDSRIYEGQESQRVILQGLQIPWDSNTYDGQKGHVASYQELSIVDALGRYESADYLLGNSYDESLSFVNPVGSVYDQGQAEEITYTKASVASSAAARVSRAHTASFWRQPTSPKESLYDSSTMPVDALYGSLPEIEGASYLDVAVPEEKGNDHSFKK